MKKIGKAAYWFAFNGMLAWLLWMALHEGVTGARNVVLFWVWLLFVVGVLALFMKPTENQIKTALESRPVPEWLSYSRTTAIVGVLVWHSWWWTALAFFIGWVGMECMSDKAKKAAKKQAAEGAAA